MDISIVTDPRAMRDFVYFPRRLYRDSAFWAPPIWREEKKAYSQERNVILANADYRLFLVRGDGGEVLGRCLTYIDHTFNEYYRTKIGFFGAFEVVEDDRAGRLLLETCEKWLSDSGMTAIRGPINPVAECWGFLLEGFSSVPVHMAPYNPAYYNSIMDGLGYKKVKDLLAYEADTENGYSIPERFRRFTSNFSDKRPQFRVRKIDIRNLMEDAEAIWKITNTALRDNWGYVPVDREVMIDMVKRLKLILNPDAVWFVEKDGDPIAYALGFPDINKTLRKIRGKFFPVGFLRLLQVKKKELRYRLFGLAVLPEFHGMGLDVLLYKHLHDALAPRGVLLEANYILEDNYNIRNALEKLELKLVKTYRVYEKSLITQDSLETP